MLLQRMNIGGISAHDGRQIEVVANGLPLWGGAQLAVDVTLVSPVRGNGQPQPGAGRQDGAQLRVARSRKEGKYRELLSTRRCRLVVLAMEVGGRWSTEALQFVQLLAKARARGVPRILRAATQVAFTQRWTGMLAVAAQRALARTLLEAPVSAVVGTDGDAPVLEDVLAEVRLGEDGIPSRLR